MEIRRRLGSRVLLAVVGISSRDGLSDEVEVEVEGDTSQAEELGREIECNNYGSASRQSTYCSRSSTEVCRSAARLDNCWFRNSSHALRNPRLSMLFYRHMAAT